MTSLATHPPADGALRALDGPLHRISREVRLLGAVTPLDAARERARLVAAFERGDGTDPRWRYAPLELPDARRQLLALSERVDAMPGSPLARLYAARVRELACEAALVDAIGTRGFGAMALSRFAMPYEASREAAALAESWLALPDEPRVESVQSDGDDDRSLLSRMREEIAKLGLAFDVVATESLAALAAIGDARIWVAAGRTIGEADVERTIVHELYGHALPRARAARLRLGIFGVGTARGGDDQEGLALVLEERGGFLGSRRKRELAGRHVVTLRMAEGASFADAARMLIAKGFTAAEAVRMAERSYRGGDGIRAGLGRERVYLESFVLVREHLARHPADLAVLASGQVSLDAVDVLRPFADVAP
jgi:hypothetical protein